MESYDTSNEWQYVPHKTSSKQEDYNVSKQEENINNKNFVKNAKEILKDLSHDDYVLCKTFMPKNNTKLLNYLRDYCTHGSEMNNAIRKQRKESTKLKYILKNMKSSDVTESTLFYRIQADMTCFDIKCNPIYSQDGKKLKLSDLQVGDYIYTCPGTIISVSLSKDITLNNSSKYEKIIEYDIVRMILMEIQIDSPLNALFVGHLHDSNQLEFALSAGKYMINSIQSAKCEFNTNESYTREILIYKCTFIQY